MASYLTPGAVENGVRIIMKKQQVCVRVFWLWGWLVGCGVGLFVAFFFFSLTIEEAVL